MTETECALTAFGERVANDLYRHHERYGSTSSRGPRIASDAGLTVLGEGGNRTVYMPAGADNDVFFSGKQACVLKVPHYGYTSQTENEIVTWLQAPPSVREVLAPVTEYHSNAHWLVMPRVRGGLPGDEDKILDKLSAAGWTCEDMHQANYGRLDNEPVILDYGYKCYPKGEEGESVYKQREEMFDE